MNHWKQPPSILHKLSSSGGQKLNCVTLSTYIFDILRSSIIIIWFTVWSIHSSCSQKIARNMCTTDPTNVLSSDYVSDTTPIPDLNSSGIVDTLISSKVATTSRYFNCVCSISNLLIVLPCVFDVIFLSIFVFGHFWRCHLSIM